MSPELLRGHAPVLSDQDRVLSIALRKASLDIQEQQTSTNASYRLRVYQACAQEFHGSGKVKIAARPAASRRRAARMGVILLAVVFCASLATGVTPLTILSLTAMNALDGLANELALQVADTVTTQLSDMTSVATTMTDTTSIMFSIGVLESQLQGGFESEECQRLAKYLYRILHHNEFNHAPYLYVGTEYAAILALEVTNTSGFVLWNRTWAPLLAAEPGGPVVPSGSLGVPDFQAWDYDGGSTLGAYYGSSLHFDPRDRPWYVLVKNGGPDFRGWTAPYIFFDGSGLGVSAARTIYNRSGDFIGVGAADITLDGVVGFLNSDAMRLTPNMRHVVLEMNGDIIGCSVPGVLTIESINGTFVRITVTDPRQPPELLQALANLQDGQSGFNISTNGTVLRLDGYYYYATVLQDSYNLQWVYIMYVPVNDFLGQAITSTFTTVGLCAGLVILIMAVALLAVWHFGAQLRRLAQDMRRATALQLDEVRSGREGTFVTEIRDICVEFDKLMNALKSLQRYLPQNQVEFLLSSNLEATIACVQQQITILFLDIANFTSVVETLADSDMLRFYGDVMTILTRKITKHQGTLDKYIGDAVMAFWNMPRAVADHETKAVMAALACRAAIPALADKGWAVDFRVGINTASCQVGNFGSQDRLNYTAIGDGVNLASRLEALCKAYHCPILISDTTHKSLDSDSFVTRLVDKVAVKGKDAVTVVYEVVGSRCDVSPAVQRDLTEYERAFGLYCDGAYAAAQQIWRRQGAQGDATAQMMADRLAKGQPSLGGVWKWETK